MTLRGTIRDGQVRLESASDLPDGTRVDVRPVAGESLMDLFRRHAISDPSLPRDFATEIDHYLYGLPKRNRRKAKAKAAGDGRAGGRKKKAKRSSKKSRG
ncbi:MAG TPA: hypothetical protein PKE29_17285 [Phycisphaerales bacterium]|nr:hypothetical protein [Phycisphaerales bacterium]